MAILKDVSEQQQLEERRTEALTFRVTPAEKERFVAECKARFMEQSEMFRHMVATFFIEKNKPL